MGAGAAAIYAAIGACVRAYGALADQGLDRMTVSRRVVRKGGPGGASTGVGRRLEKISRRGSSVAGRVCLSLLSIGARSRRGKRIETAKSTSLRSIRCVDFVIDDLLVDSVAI